MDYKTATDRITKPLGMMEVAAAMGVSESMARRAKISPDSPAHRRPPPNWREGVIRLAEERIELLQRLIEELRSP